MLWNILLASTVLTQSPTGLQELAAQLRPSVAQLQLYNGHGKKLGTGSGFFVTSDGRMVTNHHVIDGAVRVTALLHDGKEVPVLGLLRSDAEQDIAVVQVKGSGYAPLVLGDINAVKPGAEVVIMGNPMGLVGSFSAGIVSALRPEGLKDDDGKARDERKGWRLQHTAVSAPGSSGSPVLDRLGRVIGVAVGGYNGSALNFAVPVDVVQRMLGEIAVDAVVEPFDKGRPRGPLVNLGISALVLLLLYVGYRFSVGGGGRDAPKRRRASSDRWVD